MSYRPLCAAVFTGGLVPSLSPIPDVVPEEKLGLTMDEDLSLEDVGSSGVFVSTGHQQAKMCKILFMMNG